MADLSKALNDAQNDNIVLEEENTRLANKVGKAADYIATSDQIQLAVTATCVTGFGTITIPANVPTQVALAYPIHGRHRYNHSEGTDPLHLVAPNISAGATWSFTGLPTP